MQNLWSRVAQTRCTCKCPSCVFTNAAVARRAATTGRGQYVKPILQSATFTYSAIFAGAVAIDGGSKHSMRRRLEAELTEAKTRLEGALPPQNEEQQKWTQAQEDVIEGTSLAAAKGVMAMTADDVEAPSDAAKVQKAQHNTNANEETMDGMSWSDAARYDVLQEKPAWPRNTGPKIDRARLAPQSLWAQDEAAEQAATKPWSARKLRTLELAVGYFILSTLLKYDLCSDGQCNTEAVPELLRPWTLLDRFQLTGTIQSLDRALLEIRTARLADWEAVYRRQTGFIPQLSHGIPRFSQDEFGRFRDIQDELNYSIWQSLDEARKRTDGEVHRDVAMRVCNDLLCSSAPPTHRTFNLLLFGFSKLNDIDSAEMIVDLMRVAHIRPNERTCTAVLNHYTRTDNAQGFTKFIEKMRGERGGLSLARPDLPITSLNADSLVEKEKAYERKVVQKVRPTPMVLNAIIGGLLHFVGFEHSLDLVGKFQREGWGLDKDGLEIFLRDCLKAKDFNNGLKIWRQIEQLGQLKTADVTRVAIMLRLCMDCKKEEHFREIYAEAQKAVDPQKLKRLITSRTREWLRPAISSTSGAAYEAGALRRQLALYSRTTPGTGAQRTDDDFSVSLLSDSAVDMSRYNSRDDMLSKATEESAVDEFVAEPNGDGWGDAVEEPLVLDDTSWSPMVDEEASIRDASASENPPAYGPGPWGMAISAFDTRRTSTARHDKADVMPA